MSKYGKHIVTVLVSFLVIIIINFALPRLLPGDPIAYLTGYDEQDMTEEKYQYYYHALHLDEKLPVQFRYYISSLLDGTLGYSYKKDALVSELIYQKIGRSLQIMVPGTVISLLIGLVWGLECGYKKSGVFDKISTTVLIILNTLPSFAIALLLVIGLCFKNRLFPYMGLSSGYYAAGSIEFFVDRLYHLVLPTLLIILSTLPARFLLVRNTTAAFADDKSVLYAKQRGLSDGKIKFSYIFQNTAQPFVSMVGTSLGACISGSVIAENIFSIDGVGSLLTEAVNSLDYPLLQGLLFISVLAMVICIIASDVVCVLIDPRQRKGKSL